MDERFGVTLDVTIRLAEREDLEKLEWYGQFTNHRSIIDDAFARQGRGENLMLLAVANGFPVGQAWIDLAVRDDEPERVGLLWAVRVFPFLQGLGLGTRLLAAAEEALRARGFAVAEIGVEKDNPDARRLYERVGYVYDRDLKESFSYTEWTGTEVTVELDEWMLRKRLDAPGPTLETAAPYLAVAEKDG